MATGIKVFNADGTLQFDLGRRIFRHIDSVEYTDSNGSARFTKMDDDSVFVDIARAHLAPIFTFDSVNRISWDFREVEEARRRPGTVEIWAY